MHGCILRVGGNCVYEAVSFQEAAWLLVWQGIGGSVKFPRSDIRAFGFRIPVHIVVRVRPAKRPGMLARRATACVVRVEARLCSIR